jgi:hypothetical protein
MAARKCIHCDSYQDWRGEITFSSTILSLLVALVAILTAFIPAMVTVLTPNNSSIGSTFQWEEDDQLAVYAYNSGVRPGNVLYAILRWTITGR